MQDSEGFFYPQADANVCIGCGLCEKVCPVLHPYEEREPEYSYAAISNNELVRLQSSSGGIFSLLAERTISEGGVVFGARFDDHWQVIIGVAEIDEQIAAFRGSKYIQARVGNSFKHCMQYLEEGRKVLFTGTPCQVAGLKHFLRKDYPNLVTVDIICHGVPSPLVWQRYLDEVIALSRAAFRGDNKERKWSSFRLEFQEDCHSLLLSSPFRENLYMRAFLKNLILRPSCHACPVKCGKSHSDITLGDFWGIENVNPEMDDDCGTSLVLINTPHGALALPNNEMKLSEEKFWTAIRNNSAWQKSAIPHQRRAFFFDAFAKHKKGLLYLIQYNLCPTLLRRIALLRHPRKSLMYLTNRRIARSRFEDNHIIKNITFRSKRFGWKRYEMLIKLIKQ